MRRTLVITFCGLGLVVPAGALAAGGPVPPIQGGTGVAAPGGSDTLIARDAGADTVVQRVSSSSGLVERSRIIRGHYGIPGAALDGSATGLSADGRTLVLARITRIYPAARTRLRVLDGARLTPRAPIVLPGAFTVDAVSPDGRWLYLIHYRSARTLGEYEVRAYDLEHRALLAKPVVDPREPDEKMQGIPATRIMSPDGRWAYTLYDRSPNAPFIHALDTSNLSAVCIDLPSLARSAGVFDMRLSLRGGSLNVMSSDTSVAVVNTRTFAVDVPGAVAPAAPARTTHARAHASDQGGGGFPWELVALPLAAVLVMLAVVTRRRRNIRSMPA